MRFLFSQRINYRKLGLYIGYHLILASLAYLYSELQTSLTLTSASPVWPPHRILDPQFVFLYAVFMLLQALESGHHGGSENRDSLV